MVEDRDDLVALFVPAGALYKADPKQLAAQKLTSQRRPAPVTDVPWRHDMLRLMFPGASHSVWLFWEGRNDTLDIVVTPELGAAARAEGAASSTPSQPGRIPA